MDPRQIEEDIDWSALDITEAISRLQNKVKLVVSADAVCGAARVSTLTGALQKQNYICRILSLATRLGIAGSLLSDNKALWDEVFCWLEPKWQSGSTDDRWECARVVENVVNEADENFAQETGLLALIECMTLTAKEWNEISPLNYPCISARQRPWVQKCVFPLLLRCNNSNCLEGIFHLVCERQPTARWAWAHADTFVSRISSEIRERTMMIEFSESRENKKEDLISAFEIFSGGPQTPQGVKYYEGLKAGRSVAEVRDAFFTDHG